MNTRRHSKPGLIAQVQQNFRRAAPLAAAFAATLLSLPSAAIDIPNVPLQTGASYPAPNLMLILDDSGSMDYSYMPDSPPSISPSDISDLAYTRNTLSYNPATTYKAWIKANTDNTFSRLTGGLSYTAAYSDLNMASGGTINLGNSADCDSVDRNGSSVNVCGGVQTFYVPKTGATDMAATGSYYRWQILANGTDIMRGEWGTSVTSSAVTATGFPKTGLSAGTGSNAFVFTYAIPVPANVMTITATSSGGTENGNGADVYGRMGSAPSTGTYDCRSNGSNNNETCPYSPNNPGTANTYYVSIFRSGSSSTSFNNVSLTVTYTTTNRCEGTGSGNAWINCSSNLPNPARTLAEEKVNYATWFSYHRTRMKAAKAGAAEAFSQIGSNVRVGYDTIWNRQRETGQAAGEVGTPIHETTDGGLFRDTVTSTNRSNWYTKLFSADGSSSTPLRSALTRAGQYYSGADNARDPWGPSPRISCRQSFSILTTDGYWNGDSGFSAVGNDDGTATPAGEGIPDTKGGKYFYNPVLPYKDSTATSNTLADVAMYYWKRDLMASLTNDVPASGADPAYWQHMVTFGVSLGALGTLNPTVDLPAITDGTKSWPVPNFGASAADPKNIDDLWHASVNGRGSFVAATDAAEFAQALVDALVLIAARRGSGSNVATNSTSFQDNTRVYQARYLSGNWTGELAAYPATSAGIAAEPAWQASQKVPAPASRKIWTWKGGTAPYGATFPTASQLTALDQSTRPLSPVTGAENVAYIKGDSSKERRFDNGTLRNRTITVRENSNDVIKSTPLGDIVNSSPIYVSELSTIFVGANDGMLHAFNTDTGVERFAYIPGGVPMTTLRTISDPQYTHSFMVDGPIAVSTTKQTPSHNYLVGALGRGGKGVYALEVSNPDTFGASNALWELGGSDNDMGNVLGEPLVVTLNNGDKAVIVSNGPNSTNGHAVLFILNIATGALIKKIDTGAGSDNGLFAPRGWDNDNNGTVDYVYAGDLKGNLWKFDLTGVTSASWSIALSGSPLFVARDASNNRQPITAGLALALEPITGRRWVFVSTGRFISLTDITDMSVQSMYGIIDDGVADVDSRTGPTAHGDLQKRSVLVAGQVYIDTDGDGDLDGKNNNVSPATANGSDTATRDVRGFEPNATLPAGKKGWYIDLVKPPSATAEGERTVSNPRVFGTVLVTASLIPPLNDTCDAGGRGFINAVDAFTGTSLPAAFFNANGTKTGSDPNFTDDTLTSGSDTVAIGSVDLGLGMPTLPTLIDQLLVAGGSTGTLGSIGINPQGSGSRRLSWREILKD